MALEILVVINKLLLHNLNNIKYLSYFLILVQVDFKIFNFN